MILPYEWLVCFYDPIGPRKWWHRLFRPGFRHCNAIAFIPAIGHWLVVDWSLQGLATYFLTSDQMTPVLGGLQAVGRVLRVKPAEQRFSFKLGMGSIWCVLMVRHVLGFRPYAFSPWGLFCALRKSGAQEIFTGNKERVGQ